MIAKLKLAAIGLCAALLAAIAGYGYGYYSASGACKTAAEVTRLESEQATIRADLSTAKKAATDAEQRATLLAAAALDTQEMIDDLTDDVAARQDRGVCRLTDDDARRLLQLK